MSVLSRDLIKDFVKSTDDTKKEKKSTIAYGEIKVQGQSISVKLDGSDSYIPVSTKMEVFDGDRVRLLCRNHKVEITENITHPALYAQTITAETFRGQTFIGNKLQSANPTFVDGGTYAATGMEVNLSARTIKTPNFAVDSNGYLHAKGADIQGTITAENSSFEGEVTAHTGKIGAWTLDNDGYFTAAWGTAPYEYSTSISPSGITFTTPSGGAQFGPAAIAIIDGSGGVVNQYGFIGGGLFGAPLTVSGAHRAVLTSAENSSARVSQIWYDNGRLYVTAENPQGAPGTYVTKYVALT